MHHYYGLGTGTFSEYSALQKNSVQRTLGQVQLALIVCYLPVVIAKILRLERGVSSFL